MRKPPINAVTELFVMVADFQQIYFQEYLASGGMGLLHILLGQTHLPFPFPFLDFLFYIARAEFEKSLTLLIVYHVFKMDL